MVYIQNCILTDPIKHNTFAAELSIEGSQTSV